MDAPARNLAHPQHTPKLPPPVHVIFVIFDCHNVGSGPTQCGAVTLAALCSTAADATTCAAGAAAAAAAAAWLEPQALHLLLRHCSLRPVV
jgi:hypothetical protein